MYTKYSSVSKTPNRHPTSFGMKVDNLEFSKLLQGEVAIDSRIVEEEKLNKNFEHHDSSSESIMKWNLIRR